MHLQKAAVALGITTCCSLGSPSVAVDKQRRRRRMQRRIAKRVADFEDSVRKRPLAYQNEGSSPAFVTCSFVNGYNPDDRRDISYFQRMARQQASIGHNRGCTEAAGFEAGPEIDFLNKSVIVAANSASQARIYFSS